MGDQLSFINYSTERHVDPGTLSRIRSHAQQSVQDQKNLQKPKNVTSESTERLAPASTKQELSSCSSFLTRKLGRQYNGSQLHDLCLTEMLFGARRQLTGSSIVSRGASLIH